MSECLTGLKNKKYLITVNLQTSKSVGGFKTIQKKKEEKKSSILNVS